MLMFRVALPLMLLMLAGCATQIRSGSALSAHVDQQMASHHYGAALLSIDEFSASDADAEQLNRLRGHVVVVAERYESATIEAAEAQLARGDWHATQLIYRNARQRYPESSALGTAEKEFMQRRDVHIASLRIAQYAEKAKYLNAEIAQLQQINAATPHNFDTKRELQRQKDQRRLIADALLDAGERHREAKDYAAARHYLTLSNRLIASAASQQALRQLPRPSKPIARQPKAKVKPVVAKVETPALITRPDSNVDIDVEIKQALTAYRAAREQGDLLLAQRHLERAVSLQPHSNGLVAERNALHDEVQKSALEKFESGKYLYSIGDVDAAIAAWQSAAALAPGDQALQQRLERAQKFRQRYEELKQ